MLTKNGRRIRALAAGAVLVALLAGTFWGDDHHFPVGPFRMYSIANRPDGEIRANELEGVTVAGDRIELGFDSFGMRRAEVEGQVDRFTANPELLRYLVAAYEEIDPDGPNLIELRLVERVHYLRQGRVYRTERNVLAAWSES